MGQKWKKSRETRHDSSEIIEHQQEVLDSIDLSEFNPEKRREVQQLITRKADVFSNVDFDICSSTLIQMDIMLQDMTPVHSITTLFQHLCMLN